MGARQQINNGNCSGWLYKASLTSHGQVLEQLSRTARQVQKQMPSLPFTTPCGLLHHWLGPDKQGIWGWKGETCIILTLGDIFLLYPRVHCF